MVRVKRRMDDYPDIGFPEQPGEPEPEHDGINCPQYRVKPGEIPGYKGHRATLRRTA